MACGVRVVGEGARQRERRFGERPRAGDPLPSGGDVRGRNGVSLVLGEMRPAAGRLGVADRSNASSAGPRTLDLDGVIDELGVVAAHPLEAILEPAVVWIGLGAKAEPGGVDVLAHARRGYLRRYGALYAAGDAP